MWRPGPGVGLTLSFILLAVAATMVLISALVDVRTRATSPEATVRRYFAALQAGDTGAALDEISPINRDRDASFVENGAGNEYRVVGVAVRTSSILDRFRGEPGGPREATIFLDVTEAVSGARWQATPRVGLVLLQGRWYLARAPLASSG